MGKVTLIIRNAKYDKIGNFPDDTFFSKDISKTRVTERKNFKSFTEMANWIENKCKNKCKFRLMSTKTGSGFGNIKKVVFDGTDTWVEDRGSI